MSYTGLLAASGHVMDEIEQAFNDLADVSCEVYKEMLLEIPGEVRPWEKPRPENEARLSRWV